MWFESLRGWLKEDNRMSLYIHLPFCESLCTYCGCNKRITKNHSVELPYIQSIIDEWHQTVRHLPHLPIIEEIHLGGGTPTFFSSRHLERLINGIKENAHLSERITMSFEAHPSSTSFDHLITLRDLGFDRISIGVQDISPKVLQAIRRFQTEEEVEKVTFQAKALGYKSVNYDLIYGLPFQDQNDVTTTMDFVAKMKPDRIAYYSYAHVPWKSKGQRAFTEEDLLLGYDKYLLRHKGVQRLSAMGYVHIGMDHFSLPGEELAWAKEKGTLHRNFMGYTVARNRITIGLGTSAISELPDMYVQNEKTVEDYQSCIHEGSWPVIKGHRLTVKDQEVKKIILDLICKGFTTWQPNDLMERIAKDQKESLKKMSDDGLCELLPGKLSIKKKGEFFIRNVCSLLDPYLNVNTKTESRFSQVV